MEKSVTFTLYHQYENDILNTGTGAAKMLKNVQVACSCACVFISERSVCRLYFFGIQGRNYDEKAWDQFFNGMFDGCAARVIRCGTE